MKSLAFNKKTIQPLSDGENSYLLSIGCGNKFVHNNRTAFEDGIMCRDCGRFIKKGTLEHFMTAGHLSIYFSIHNRGVRYSRGECDEDVSEDLEELSARLRDTNGLIKMTEKEAMAFMKETYSILEKHEVKDNEASKKLNLKA